MMKGLFGWLLDPYVHLFVIGLILVRLAMALGGDAEPVEMAADEGICKLCGESHQSAPHRHPVVYRASVR